MTAKNPLIDSVPDGTLGNCRNALAVLSHLDLENLGNDPQACAGVKMLIELLRVTLDDGIQRVNPAGLREVGGGAS